MTNLKHVLMENEENMEILNHCCLNKQAVLLTGPHGTGKTTAVGNICGINKMDITTKMGGTYHPSRLYGAYQLSASKGNTETRFVTGPLTDRVKNGQCFYLDEVDNCSEEILDGFHSLLDDRRYLSIADIGHPVAGKKPFLKAHSNFWFVASCIDRSRLPRDFIDRFRVLEFKPISEHQQVELLLSRCRITEKAARQIVSVGQITLASDWQSPVSTRQLISAGHDVRLGISVITSVMINIVNPNYCSVQELEALNQALMISGEIELPLSLPEKESKPKDFRDIVSDTFKNYELDDEVEDEDYGDDDGSWN